MRIRRIAALLALGATIGCGSDGPTEPPVVLGDAVPILPIPENYRVWWGELEACSGLRGNVNGVRFYVVESLAAGPNHVGQTTWGRGPTVIVLTEWAQNNETVVKHEMMHALLRTSEHPREYFNGRCGDIALSGGSTG